jgi:putative hydrolase of the HAD superfamily
MADDGPPVIRAVIFDLYGTLVPEFPADEFSGSVDHMAETLGAPVDAFREAWHRTAPLRQTGGYATIEDNVRSIANEVGAPAPSDEELRAALRERDAMYARWFHPRLGAVETLTELTARGFGTALISMCAPDTPAMWHASPLSGLVDVEVFSCEVGLRKPDPAIYAYACEGLGVGPTECLYCGDGAYGELTGAAALGMTAVEIRDPTVDISTLLRLEADSWTGTRIAELRELLDMV